MFIKKINNKILNINSRTENSVPTAERQSIETFVLHLLFFE